MELKLLQIVGEVNCITRQNGSGEFEVTCRSYISDMAPHGSIDVLFLPANDNDIDGDRVLESLGDILGPKCSEVNVTRTRSTHELKRNLERGAYIIRFIPFQAAVNNFTASDNDQLLKNAFLKAVEDNKETSYSARIERESQVFSQLYA